MNDTNQNLATTRISIKFKANVFEARRVTLQKRLIYAGWLPTPKPLSVQSPKIERDIHRELEALNAQVSERALREFGSAISQTLEITLEEFVGFLRQDFRLTAARLNATISLYETAIIGSGFEEDETPKASV